MSNDIIIPGDEAYLSFGGWAKPMPNPPRMHERRRYVVDVECTDAELKSSSKGERGTRKLSILRVFEVTGAKVAPKRKGDDDEDMDAPPMFAADGTIPDDPKSLAEEMAAAARDVEASADEGDEIMAERREAAEAAAADKGVDQEAGDPWPGDDAADADVADDPDNVPPADDDPQAGDVEVIDEATDGEEWDPDPATGNDGSGNVTALFKEAQG